MTCSCHCSDTDRLPTQASLLDVRSVSKALCSPRGMSLSARIEIHPGHFGGCLIEAIHMEMSRVYSMDFLLTLYTTWDLLYAGMI